MDDGINRLRISFVGDVQGVGFRWTSRSIATKIGLTGWVRNEDDGSVTAELQGTSDQIGRFFTQLLASFRRYHLSFRIDQRENIPVVPDERDFSVRF